MNPKRLSEAEIGRKAYELWEAEGRPEGRDVAHWHQAERDISEPVVAPIADSLPASEPVPKPRTTRARKPRAAEDAADAAGTAPKAAKPKTPRRGRPAEPGA